MYFINSIIFQVGRKVPGRAVIWLVVAATLVVVLVIGVAIGYATRSGRLLPPSWWSSSSG